DVTQDVLLQVVRRLDTFRGQARFTTWLDRVTLNAALARRRRRARRERQLDAPLDGLPGACVSRRGGAPRGPGRGALGRERGGGGGGVWRGPSAACGRCTGPGSCWPTWRGWPTPRWAACSA